MFDSLALASWRTNYISLKTMVDEPVANTYCNRDIGQEKSPDDLE